MNSIVKIACFCLTLSCSSQMLFGQKSLKKQAEILLQKKNYTEALKTLEVYNNIKKDASAQFQKGICSYYVNKPEDCISAMNEALNLGLFNNHEPYFYIAKSYQDLGNFSLAAKNYKTYLNNVDSKNIALVNNIITEIKRCEYSEKIGYLPQIAYLENFGLSVNSPFDELSPLQSRNFQNKFYFSSNRENTIGGARAPNGSKDDLSGQYFYDMFATEFNKGNYNPATIFQVQNTSKNELIQDFSTDGSVMYYMRYTTLDDAKFIADTFVDEQDRLAESEFKYNIQATKGDKDFTFFNDSTVFFASNRLGGYGGYDIYAMQKLNGQWLQPINLGSNINSIFDEVSPYITKGGHTLFFSSNHINGLGGMDIFASQYNTSNLTWSERINLGTPINSTKDDIDPLITNDGTQVLLSSNRIGSTGGYDLYVAYLKDQINDQFTYSEVLPFFNHDSTFQSDDNALTKNNTSASTNNNATSKAFINVPIYYNTDENFISNVNTAPLKNLKNILDIYPEIQLNIIGHSGIDQQKDYSLFFTIKRVEKIAAYLIELGIKSERIKLHSYGNSFPASTTYSSRFNSRIDFILDNVNKNLLEITEERPVINSDLINPAFTDYGGLLNGLVYKVKIATTKQMMKNDLLIEYPYTSIYKSDQGEYEYYVGYKATYEEANHMKVTLQNKGISQAKVVPFVNHTQVNEDNIVVMASKYADLMNYVQQEK